MRVRPKSDHSINHVSTGRITNEERAKSPRWGAYTTFNTHIDRKQVWFVPANLPSNLHHIPAACPTGTDGDDLTFTTLGTQNNAHS